MASKVVVLGSLQGSLTVFDKLAKVHAKQAFSFAIICGDLFADPASEFEESESIDRLLNGQITVPLPTYFTICNYALPTKIVDRLTQNNDEICSNLFFLDKRSIFKTSEGVRIVALGGRLNTEIIGNAVEDKYLPFHTEHDAKVLNGAHNADILITSSWPAGVRTSSNVKLPEDMPEPHSEQCVAELARVLKPRYHFCSSPDLFFEREPFFFRPSENAQDMTAVTRFLSLASPSSQTKQKWLYAFNIDPTGSAPTQLPAGVTPTPYLSPISTKRSLPDHFDGGYRYSNPDRDGHGGYHNGKRRRNQRTRAPPKQSQCFFCLSNNPSTHLIAAIGDDTYLTTSRGPVSTAATFSPYFSCPAQILIIPFAHAPTIASIPSSAGDNLERTNSYAEMLRFRKSLNEMLRAKGQGNLGSVCWEVNKQAGVHVHWQWMPIPISLIQKGLIEAGLKVQAEGDGYGAFEKKEIGDGVDQGGDWFRVWVWQPAASADQQDAETSWFLPFDSEQRFDLQFGRRVVAKLLNTPERAHWKDVVQPEDEEKKDVQAFKVAFKEWDFTGTA